MTRIPAVVASVCLGMGCIPADSLFGDGAGGEFSSREWARLSALSRSRLAPRQLDPTNAVDGKPLAVELGRRFFSDTRFSGVSKQVDVLGRPAAVGRAPAGDATNLSCVSCHDLANGGADTASIPGNVSSGAGWTDVNALPIANLAYQHLYTWNGRADSLWAQAFAVAENPATMNGDRLNTMHVIFDDLTYYTAYVNVFGLPPKSIAPGASVYPPHGKQGTPEFDALPMDVQLAITGVQVNWAKALAAYEGTLVTGDTPFDRFVAEGPTSDAISPAAKRGARLFVGKAGCIDCHNTPLLSDGGFHNVGVPQSGPGVPTLADCPAGNAVCDCTGAGKNCLPWGEYDGLMKLGASKMLRTSVMWSDAPGDRTRDEDAKRTPTDAFKGAWRTPSLRNVALTGPYMHDGLYASLDEVVAHYSRGPDPGAVGTPAPDIKPLLLADGEQADLVAFLNTLNADIVVGPPPGTTGGGGAAGTTGPTGPTGAAGSGSVGGTSGAAGGPAPSSGLPCDVETFLKARCQPCHGVPPTDGAPFSLVSYADVRTYASLAVAAMTTGEMPLGGPPATPAEIQIMQGWIDAGYPIGACPAPPGAGCPGAPPATADITGSALSPSKGPVFTFAGTGVPLPMVAAVTLAGSFGVIDEIQVAANPGIVLDPANAYVGFGLPFGSPPCVDARAYSALRFTITGDVGSCSLQASLVPSEDNSTQNGPFGTCVLGTGCVPPFSGPIGTGTVTTCFSEMTGGVPLATVDPATLNAVQWILRPPSDPSAVPCNASFTVSAVSLVLDPTCP